MKSFYCSVALLFLIAASQISLAQCNFVSLNVSYSDSSQVNLYHPGFFLFGMTPDVGGFDNVCYWTVSTMSGDIIHEDVTAGDWESQSFMLFEHEETVNDSMLVELNLTNPLEDFDCCMTDTLVWMEDELFGAFGSWQVLSLGLNVGEDCEVTTSVDETPLRSPITIYPQPATSHFWVNDISNAARVVLYDLRGSLVAEFSVAGEQALFDIKFLPEGVYLVQIMDKNSRTIGVQRLIKQS